MKLYMLVEVETSAPPEKYGQVAIAVARRLHHEFGPQVRSFTAAPRASVATVLTDDWDPVHYDPVLDDGNL